MDQLSKALSATGNKVYVLAPFDSQIKKNFRRTYKLITYRYIYPDSFHRLGYSRTLIGDKSLKLETYLLSPFMYFFGFFALLRTVRKYKIDIISSHWIVPNGFVASMASLVTGVPFTTTIPGSDVYMGTKNIFFRILVGIAAVRANYVLSDSSHYLKQLNSLGFFPKKTEVIRYGVNAKEFLPKKKDSQILKKLSINKSAPTVVAVGRMVAKKGYIYLIRSIPSVLRKVPKAKFILVGDGDERERLQSEVQKLKISKSVIFAGTISYSDLAKYYNLADVFVMPSIRDEKGNIDASPVAMMEAMACGSRVVATKFSGSDDLIIPGKTGYLVKEKDSKSIATSVIKLLLAKNRSLAKKQARKIAVDNFSVDNVARKYLQIFNNVLQNE